MRSRQIVERIWRWLNGLPVLVLPLLLLAAVSLLGVWLPQAPVLPGDTAAFSRWLASIHPRLDPYTDKLAAWGLLTLRTTLWTRLPLALLALVFAVRGTRLYECWTAWPVLLRVREGLILLGLVGLLLGWGVQLRWGWAEAGVLAWPGEPLQLEHGRRTLPPLDDASRVRLHEGLFLLPEALAWGLEVEARNAQGELLPVQLAARSAAQPQARFVLSEQLPDGYFGIPEADLVFRIALQQPPPEARIQVQIYRSSTGTLLTETLLQGSGMIFADPFRFQLQGIPVSLLRVVYNPGVPFTFLAWLCLGAAGVVAVGVRRRVAQHENAATSAENAV